MTSHQTSTARTWTVLSLLEWTAEHLRSRGFDEARLTVDLLLAHVLRLRRLDLYLQFDRELLPAELAAFKVLYERRLNHEPLQYITGTTDFMGLRLNVRPGVLIPRPETEQLVEQVVAAARELSSASCRILDIGTGTGNIALAIARLLPDATVTSIDTSREALDLAVENAALNGVARVAFLAADLFGDALADQTWELIVSNPPYIPAAEYANLEPEVREFEPRSALTDEGDGLRFFSRIAFLAAHALVPGGRVLVEVGAGQAGPVGDLLTGAGLCDLRIGRDYAGIERIVAARQPADRS